MRTLIVGCGYVGVAIAARLHQAGHEVFGLRRSAVAPTASAGIQPVQADVTDPESLAALPVPLDWVVYCVSAGRSAPDTYRAAYLEGTRNLLKRLSAAPPQRFLYTSSSGVYGQNDGSWVTESSEAIPPGETGRILAEAEQLVLHPDSAAVSPGIVVRLAGIYGPGRDYWRRQFLEGNATLDGDGSRCLNMIHREDVAGAVVAALERGRAGEIYNVVDNEPIPQKELFQWLSRRMGRPMPSPGPSRDSLRKRGVTNKRISNRKLREQLNYQLQYPTFREGYETL